MFEFSSVPKGRPHSHAFVSAFPFASLIVWENVCSELKQLYNWCYRWSISGKRLQPFVFKQQLFVEINLGLSFREPFRAGVAKTQYFPQPWICQHQGQVKPNCRTVCLWHPEPFFSSLWSNLSLCTKKRHVCKSVWPFRQRAKCLVCLPHADKRGEHSSKPLASLNITIDLWYLIRSR